MRKLLTFVLLALTIAVASGQSVTAPAGRATRIIRAASLPATCTVGDVYFKTAATVGTYQCLTTNNWTVMGGGGGSGTVTSASVVTANGVSGSVATATTTPAITLTLGNITPTSVSTGGTPPSLTPGTGGALALAEGTVPGTCAASAVICIYGDSTQHGIKASFNNGSYLPLVQGPASATSGHVATFNGTNGGLLQDGGTVPTVTGGTCTNQVATAISGSAIPTCTTVTSAYVDSSIATSGANTFTGTQTNNGSYAGSAKLPVSLGGAVAQASNACGTSDLCASGNLTSAQIVTVTSTSSSFLTLISAPASGSMIVLDSIDFEGAYNGTAYAGGSNFQLYYGTSGVTASSLACGAGNLTGTSKVRCNSLATAASQNNITNFNAVAVVFGISGASFTCASTCGPLYYWIKYHIVTGLQ